MLFQGVMKVNDMSGKQWRRSAKVEQTAVASYGCTVVYWRIKE